jgi:release factor glutamine methyltransferase
LRDKDDMHPNVLLYEPHKALFVDNNDPLLFYKALVQFGKHRLYPGGRLYMEIHETLGREVVALFRQEGYDPVELRKDMQGKDRMVMAGKE